MPCKATPHRCSGRGHDTGETPPMYLDLIGHVLIPLRDRLGNVKAYTVVDRRNAHLARWRWRLIDRDRYVARHDEDRRGGVVLLHREILGLCHGDERQGDHIDGNTLDNRRSNLRVVTHAQNSQNVVQPRRGTSIYRGVSWNALGRNWRVRVAVGGVTVDGGLFTEELAAAEAARALRAKHMTHNVETRA
jgi:hypothetical protein